MIRNKKKQNEIIELIPYGLKATCIALSILNRMIKNHKNRKYADEYSECGKLICDIDANNPTANPLIRDNEHKYKEADYVNAYCKGIIEYKLPDKTRVDCLSEEYAIEFDWATKWAESVGQSLYYAKMTDKKPAVAIIMKKMTDERYIKRIEAVDKNITIFRIKAYKEP